VEYVIVKVGDAADWVSRLLAREQHSEQCARFLGVAIERHRARRTHYQKAPHLPQRLMRASWSIWSRSNGSRC
jgi:hypothetical protein